MKSSITAEAIWSDIEFELAQGAIANDELGAAIRAVRQFQAQTRAQSVAKPGALDLVGRQFQIMDMLIALIQELALTTQALRVDLRRVTQRPLPAPDLSTPALVSAPNEPSSPAPAVTAPPSELPVLAMASPPRLDEIAALMRAETLALEPHVLPSRLPLIGGWVTKLKYLFFHLAPLDYSRQLSAKQIRVNQVYGEWLMQLYTQNAQHQAHIAALTARLAELEARSTATPK